MMNIKSEGTSNNIVRKLVNWANLWLIIIASIYILAMSYGKIPAEPMHVMFFGVIRFIFTNIAFSLAPREALQKLEDEPFGAKLASNMILGPVVLFLSLWCLVVLVIGNMVGWGWYIVTIIGINIIANAHKTRKGVITKSDRKKEVEKAKKI